ALVRKRRGSGGDVVRRVANVLVRRAGVGGGRIRLVLGEVAVVGGILVMVRVDRGADVVASLAQAPDLLVVRRLTGRLAEPAARAVGRSVALDVMLAVALLGRNATEGVPYVVAAGAGIIGVDGLIF